MNTAITTSFILFLVFIVYAAFKNMSLLHVMYGCVAASFSLFLIRIFLGDMSIGKAFLRSFDIVILIVILLILWDRAYTKKEKKEDTK